VRSKLPAVLSLMVLISLALPIAGCRHNDAEAMAAATTALNKTVTKCGNVYYMWNGMHAGFIEFKEKPRLSIAADGISDVDRMNGYSWKGSAAFSSSAERLIFGRAKYDWDPSTTYSFYLYERNGIWYRASSNISPNMASLDSYNDSVPCEQLPQ